MAILFDGRFSGGIIPAAYQTIQVNNFNNSPALNPNGIAGKLEVINNPNGAGLVSAHTLNRADSTRCELACPTDPIGSTRWYYNSVMLDPDWIVDWIGEAEVILQIHDTPDAGDPNREPPFSVRVFDNRMQIIRCHENVGNTSKVVIDWQAPLKLGVWMDFIYKITWKSDNTGALTAWLDGRKIVDLQNIPTCYNDVGGNYAKLGPYKYFHVRSPLQQRKTFYSGTVISQSLASYEEFAKELGLPDTRQKERVISIGSANF